jgi:predicted site-specific integrase-resolvase
MKRRTSFRYPSLQEIAEVLEIPADTVLQWVIEGRLVVTRQESQAIMMVDPPPSLKNQKAGKHLILTKKPANHKWLPLSS